MGVLIVYMDPGISEERIEKVLDSAKSAGAKWVRIGIIWELIQPEKGVYNFSEYDRIIENILDKGLKPLPVVIGTPKWASSCEDSPYYYYCPPTFNKVDSSKTGYDYLKTFAQKLSERYKNKITHFEFWNEPDTLYFLHDTNQNGTSADEYGYMLKSFYMGIKSGNPDAKVLIGGLAYDERENLCDKDFLKKLFEFHPFIFLFFDIMNIHLNFRAPEEIPEIVKSTDKYSRKVWRKKDIWVTEISYSPVKRFQILDGYKNGEESFEMYIFDSILETVKSGVKVVFWAPLFDYPSDVDDDFPFKYSGLYTFELSPKKAVNIFKLISELISL